jgi:hypothetical protein
MAERLTVEVKRVRRAAEPREAGRALCRPALPLSSERPKSGRRAQGVLMQRACTSTLKISVGQRPCAMLLYERTVQPLV